MRRVSYEILIDAAGDHRVAAPVELFLTAAAPCVGATGVSRRVTALRGALRGGLQRSLTPDSPVGWLDDVLLAIARPHPLGDAHVPEFIAQRPGKHALISIGSGLAVVCPASGAHLCGGAEPSLGSSESRRSIH